MTRSGWCGLGIPLGHTNHGRCHLDGCRCDCHQAATQTPAAEDAPGDLKASGSEPWPSAAGPRKPGFYDGIEEEAYHSDPHSLSHSGAKTILKAPALFRHGQLHPVFKKEFDFGHAAHAKVLGAGAEIRAIPDDILASNGATSTKEAKSFIAKARADGAVPLKAVDVGRVDEMADKLSEHTLAMELLSDGRPEVSGYAEDPDTGITLRCRFDWLGRTILTDYKSATSADPQQFRRKAAEFGYHQQAPWYLDLAAVLGHPAEAFAFIVQAKEPPYLVTVVELVDRAVDRGRELNRRAIDTYAACLAAGTWPGYIPNTTYASVDIPTWAYDDTHDHDLEISA